MERDDGRTRAENNRANNLRDYRGPGAGFQSVEPGRWPHTLLPAFLRPSSHSQVSLFPLAPLYPSDAAVLHFLFCILRFATRALHRQI